MIDFSRSMYANKDDMYKAMRDYICDLENAALHNADDLRARDKRILELIEDLNDLSFINMNLKQKVAELEEDWISVDYALPETNTFVDVFCKNERFTDIEFIGGIFSELILDDEGDYSHSVELDPSHWKPLPSPPKE